MILGTSYCPPLCPADDKIVPNTTSPAIPLYDSVSPNCSGQPKHPKNPLNNTQDNPPDSANNPLNNPDIPHHAGHRSCNEDIVMQPYNPLSLNSQYVQRASKILKSKSKVSRQNNVISDISNISEVKKDKDTTNSPDGPDNPFLLYIAFAHTHSPLAYDSKFENSSNPDRPGFNKVFGNLEGY